MYDRPTDLQLKATVDWRSDGAIKADPMGWWEEFCEEHDLDREKALITWRDGTKRRGYNAVPEILVRAKREEMEAVKIQPGNRTGPSLSSDSVVKGVKIPRGVMARIKLASRREGVSDSDFIRRAIEKELSKLTR